MANSKKPITATQITQTTSILSILFAAIKAKHS